MVRINAISIISLTMCLSVSTSCQNRNELITIQTGEVTSLYSGGVEERAQAITNQIDRAIKFGNDLLGFTPDVRLLILSKQDWSDHTEFPVYGMPRYSDSKTLILAAEDNAYWNSFLPPLDRMEPGLARTIQDTYTDKNGNLSMVSFFDLVGLHELAHAFHNQAGINMQRTWLKEYFANLFMFTFIAEKEPELIPVLEVFSEMVVANGTAGYQYLTIQQFEKEYHRIAREAPGNYGWYQSKMNIGAIELYRAGSSKVLEDLWVFLQRTEKVLSDDKLFEMLGEEVHPAMESFFSEW